MMKTILAWITCLTLGNAAEPFHWGVNGHPVSQEGYWQVPLVTQLDLTQELGAGWYRLDVTFSAFQASTTRLDELLAEAEKRGVKLLPVLVPDGDFFEGATSVDQVRRSSADFGQAITSRYKGRITHWELGNEMDSYAMIKKGEPTRSGKLWEWDGAPDGSRADDYHQGRYERVRALLQGLNDGVKASDPAALTMVDTAGWLHYGFIDRLVTEDRLPFDILAWHWYSEMGDMTRVQGKLDLIELLKRYGKPLWITEVNRRDGSKGGRHDDAAAYLSRVARQMREHPAIHAFFVYELLDEPYFGLEGESDYGLVTLQKGSSMKWEIAHRKPAFHALQTVIKPTAKE